MRKQRIQIPTSLYNLMTAYIEDHYDPSDRDRFFEIQRGIQEKKHMEERHNIYSSYTAETDPETKETLRSLYFDKTGLMADGNQIISHTLVRRTTLDSTLSVTSD